MLLSVGCFSRTEGNSSAESSLVNKLTIYLMNMKTKVSEQLNYFIGTPKLVFQFCSYAQITKVVKWNILIFLIK